MKLKELQIEINEAIEQVNIPMLCVIQEHGHGKLIDGELENFSEEHKKKLHDEMQEKVKKVASSIDDVKFFKRQKKDCLKSIEDILLPDVKDRALYKLNKFAKEIGFE